MRPLQALWRLAIHPVTFVVICLLWCLDLGLGSLLAYQRQDIFGTMDAYPFALWLREVGRRTMPWSVWVYLLAALTWAMTASLAVCTMNWFWRRRKSLRGLGEVLVHLGFLLIFTGFVVEAVLGTRVHGVQVIEGGEAAIGQLGISLRLEHAELTRSPEGEVLDTVSTLAVVEGASRITGTSRLNHPLIAGTMVVYPRGSREVPTPRGPLIIGRYDVHRDPGIRAVLAGAVLLFAGTLWAFGTYVAGSPRSKAPRLEGAVDVPETSATRVVGQSEPEGLGRHGVPRLACRGSHGVRCCRP
jgi:cytochrome c biogenesis factor